MCLGCSQAPTARRADLFRSGREAFAPLPIPPQRRVQRAVPTRNAGMTLDNPRCTGVSETATLATAGTIGSMITDSGCETCCVKTSAVVDVAAAATAAVAAATGFGVVSNAGVAASADL